MSNVDLREGNKLLVSFMGWEHDGVEFIAPNEYMRTKCFNHVGNSKVVESYTTTIFKYRDAEFNSSYDWLIAVVSKIRDLGYYIDIKYGDLEGGIKESWSDIDNIVRVGCVPNPCVSNPPTKENPIFVREFNDPKEALYTLLVRFVKWYKLNKKG